MPLLGARPQIADIGYNGPSIHLPPNVSTVAERKDGESNDYDRTLEIEHFFR